MDTKKCTKCGEVKAMGEFHFRKDSGKTRGECSKCTALRAKNWATKNKEARAKIRRKSSMKNKHLWVNQKKRSVDELTNSYVASVMRTTVKDATPELLEAKRQQILIHRATKQLIQTIKEKQDEH